MVLLPVATIQLEQKITSSAPVLVYATLPVPTITSLAEVLDDLTLLVAIIPLLVAKPVIQIPLVSITSLPELALVTATQPVQIIYSLDVMQATLSWCSNEQTAFMKCKHSLNLGNNFFSVESKKYSYEKIKKYCYNEIILTYNCLRRFGKLI